jgi:hypothetical protein
MDDYLDRCKQEDLAKEKRLRTEKAVRAIVDDLQGRSGLGNEWDNIDDFVKAEIVETWERIVLHAFTKFAP